MFFMSKKSFDEKFDALRTELIEEIGVQFEELEENINTSITDTAYDAVNDMDLSIETDEISSEIEVLEGNIRDHIDTSIKELENTFRKLLNLEKKKDS